VTILMVHLGVRRFVGFDCERFLRRIRVFGRRFTRGAGRVFLGFRARCRVTARVRTVETCPMRRLLEIGPPIGAVGQNLSMTVPK
jgi:hypothetical protein